MEEQADAKGAGRPVVAVTLAVVKVAQKADADARLAEKAAAQASEFGFVQALIRLGRAAVTRRRERIMEGGGGDLGDRE